MPLRPQPYTEVYQYLSTLRFGGNLFPFKVEPDQTLKINLGNLTGLLGKMRAEDILNDYNSGHPALAPFPHIKIGYIWLDEYSFLEATREFKA